MYQNISEVRIELLKQRCTQIQYFGLGFIQIKLGEVHRIHFYSPQLPAIVGDEDIHNHRYDFASSIFSGSFMQEIFALAQGNTHTCETESCKEGTERMGSPRPCGIRKIMEQHFSLGNKYFIAHDVFHRVRADKAITFLTRGQILKNSADVVRPVGAPTICPFSQKISEDRLWDIVSEMLDEAHQMKADTNIAYPRRAAAILSAASGLANARMR